MLYTQEHEWIVVEGDVAKMGITQYAADALGDVVFVELPAVGAQVKQGDGMCVVESVKAASDVYAPLDGEVVDVNDALTASPESINTASEDGAWFAKIRIQKPEQLEGLMDRDAYQAFLKTL